MRVEKTRIGYLVLDGWAGRSLTAVEVIGQTPRRFRIRAIHLTRLGGRGRWLVTGEAALVPKTAVYSDHGTPFVWKAAADAEILRRGMHNGDAQDVERG
jgi:hypothetical protein